MCVFAFMHKTYYKNDNKGCSEGLEVRTKLCVKHDMYEEGMNAKGDPQKSGGGVKAKIGVKQIVRKLDLTCWRTTKKV